MQISTLAAIGHRLRFPSKWHRIRPSGPGSDSLAVHRFTNCTCIAALAGAYDRAESAPRVSPKRTRRPPPPALLPPLLPLSPSFLHSRSPPAPRELRRKSSSLRGRRRVSLSAQVHDSALPCIAVTARTFKLPLDTFFQYQPFCDPVLF